MFHIWRSQGRRRAAARGGRQGARPAHPASPPPRRSCARGAGASPCRSGSVCRCPRRQEPPLSPGQGEGRPPGSGLDAPRGPRPVAASSRGARERRQAPRIRSQGEAPPAAANSKTHFTDAETGVTQLQVAGAVQARSLGPPAPSVHHAGRWTGQRIRGAQVDPGARPCSLASCLVSASGLIGAGLGLFI